MTERVSLDGLTIGSASVEVDDRGTSILVSVALEGLRDVSASSHSRFNGTPDTKVKFTFSTNHPRLGMIVGAMRTKLIRSIVARRVIEAFTHEALEWLAFGENDERVHDPHVDRDVVSRVLGAPTNEIVNLQIAASDVAREHEWSREQAELDPGQPRETKKRTTVT